jgi:hypothetical protein
VSLGANEHQRGSDRLVAGVVTLAEEFREGIARGKAEGRLR